MNLKDENIRTTLGNNLKKIRLGKKLTQEQLAEKINISTQLLKDIEAGRKLGSLNTFINICIALNETPNTLLYELFINNIKDNDNLTSKIDRLSERDKKIVENLINNMLD